MNCSGSVHDDQHVLETMPIELLPLHHGLEEDGSSWRAALPLADDLLRRVTVRPLRPTCRVGAKAQPGSRVAPRPTRSTRHPHRAPEPH